MENLTINTRIEFLRKKLRLNQAAFGEHIGLGGGAIGKMERGGTVTDQNIKLICEKFHIRRDWLIHGEGEMSDSKENSLFASFANQYGLNEAEQNAARFLLALPADERRKMLHYVTLLADAVKGRKPQQDFIDAETAKFRSELEAIQDAAAQGKQSPSTAISGEKRA